LKIKFNKLKYWLPSFFWLIIMFVMSSISIEESGKRNIIGLIVQSIKRFFLRSSFEFVHYIGIHTDKIYHAFEYAIFTLLVFFALRKSHNLNSVKAFTIIAILSPVIGVADEIHQRLTPSRIPQMADFIADMTGTAFMMILIAIFYVLRRTHGIQKD